MSPTTLFLFIFIIHVALSILVINKPPNGIGPIEISKEDNDDYEYNEERVLFAFNRSCIRILSKSDNIDQIEANIKTISSLYSMCLNITQNTNDVTHYDTDSHSFTFFDLGCTLYSIQEGQHKNISLDYDNLCIDWIMFEPLFKTTQSTQDDITDSFACMRLNTGYYESYGMDLLDSEFMDYRYSYPQYLNDSVSDSNKIDLYILDSGIQSNHIEFEPNQIEHAMGDGPTRFGSKYGVHGTHVAGIAAGINYGASRKNKIFDLRVCEWAKDGEEMPCYASKIFEALTRILVRLKRTQKRGVINLSLGGPKVLNDAYHAYFAYIIDVGGIVVVAAGNEDQNACNVSPAYSSNAITVGSFDRSRKKSHFSNWGSCFDIWAPGTGIYSSIASDKRDKYEYKQGTSMAAPYITGVVANLLYIHPNLSFDQIKQSLMSMDVKRVDSGVCSSQFECFRVQYICESPIVYDLPHILTIFDIVMIVIGCVAFCCIATCVGLIVVKCRRDKIGNNEKKKYDRTNDEDVDEMIDDEAETQCINVDHEGNECVD